MRYQALNSAFLFYCSYYTSMFYRVITTTTKLRDTDTTTEREFVSREENWYLTEQDASYQHSSGTYHTPLYQNVDEMHSDDYFYFEEHTSDAEACEYITEPAYPTTSVYYGAGVMHTCEHKLDPRKELSFLF